MENVKLPIMGGLDCDLNQVIGSITISTNVANCIAKCAEEGLEIKLETVICDGALSSIQIVPIEKHNETQGERI